MPYLERPSIENLHSLLAVADCGIVRQAAKGLRVRQPTVSKQLDVFRQANPLFRTRDNQVELTDAGRLSRSAACLRM